MFRTEFEFVLPRGYVDADNVVHREGAMRLATAADEILPLKDPRVQANPAYLVIILFSRTVTRLGSLEVVNPKVIEGLFSADLQYLQGLYNRINGLDDGAGRVTCPHCRQEFDLPEPSAGGSSATPTTGSAGR
jgi:hypothetical protein